MTLLSLKTNFTVTDDAGIASKLLAKSERADCFSSKHDVYYSQTTNALIITTLHFRENSCVTAACS